MKNPVQFPNHYLLTQKLQEFNPSSEELPLSVTHELESGVGVTISQNRGDRFPTLKITWPYDLAPLHDIRSCASHAIESLDQIAADLGDQPNVFSITVDLGLKDEDGVGFLTAEITDYIS